MGAPSSIEGDIKYVGDLDYFSFQAQAGITYVFTVVGDTSGGFAVTLSFPPSTSGDAPIMEARPVTTDASSTTYTPSRSQVLYVVVQNNWRGTGPYTLGIFILDAGSYPPGSPR